MLYIKLVESWQFNIVLHVHLFMERWTSAMLKVLQIVYKHWVNFGFGITRKINGESEWIGESIGIFWFSVFYTW